MNECTKRGCRRLKLCCEDCERVVSTAHRPEEDEHEWKDIERFPPAEGERCEYRITVTCKGWYKPNEGQAMFYGDPRHPPIGQIQSWREWKEGPGFEEGVEQVKKFTEEKIAEQLPNDGGPAA